MCLASTSQKQRARLQRAAARSVIHRPDGLLGRAEHDRSDQVEQMTRHCQGQIRPLPLTTSTQAEGTRASNPSVGP